MNEYPDRMTPGQARQFREAVFDIVAQIPCCKVTTYGHIAALAGWLHHRDMLEAEGVTFLANGHVDMKQHQWKTIEIEAI